MGSVSLFILVGSEQQKKKSRLFMTPWTAKHSCQPSKTEGHHVMLKEPPSGGWNWRLRLERGGVWNHQCSSRRCPERLAIMRDRKINSKTLEHLQNPRSKISISCSYIIFREWQCSMENPGPRKSVWLSSLDKMSKHKTPFSATIFFYKTCYICFWVLVSRKNWFRFNLSVNENQSSAVEVWSQADL